MALAGVAEYSAETKAKREAAEKDKKYYRPLFIGDKETVNVRFLEDGDDFYFKWFHNLKEPFWHWVRCLDQEGDGDVYCPGCELLEEDENGYEKARRAKRFYINVIWKNAPVFDREEPEEGKSYGEIKRDENDDPIVIDRKDAVAWWTGGIPVAEILDLKDEKTKNGLKAREWEITRNGVKTDTTYEISVAMDEEGENSIPPAELTAAEKKLAKAKYDLAEMTTPPSVEDYLGFKKKGGSGSKSSGKSAFGSKRDSSESGEKKNVFTSRRKDADKDEE